MIALLAGALAVLALAGGLGALALLACMSSTRLSRAHVNELRNRHAVVRVRVDDDAWRTWTPNQHEQEQ